jgi:hypothetical protein
VGGEHHEVLRLTQQARVHRRRAQAEDHAHQRSSHQAHPPGRAPRRARGRGGGGPREDEAIEAALQVAQAPQLVADLVHAGQRRARPLVAVRRHGRDSK